MWKVNKFLLVLFIGLLVLAGTAIVGCDVNPSKITAKHASDLAEKITYTKDTRTGLCFGVIASRKTGDTDQTGMGMTTVPCEKVEHLIK
jgi:hypothetical protein